MKKNYNNNNNYKQIPSDQLITLTYAPSSGLFGKSSISLVNENSKPNLSIGILYFLAKF